MPQCYQVSCRGVCASLAIDIDARDTRRINRTANDGNIGTAFGQRRDQRIAIFGGKLNGSVAVPVVRLPNRGPVGDPHPFEHDRKAVAAGSRCLQHSVQHAAEVVILAHRLGTHFSAHDRNIAAASLGGAEFDRRQTVLQGPHGGQHAVPSIRAHAIHPPIEYMGDGCGRNAAVIRYIADRWHLL